MCPGILAGSMSQKSHGPLAPFGTRFSAFNSFIVHKLKKLNFFGKNFFTESFPGFARENEICNYRRCVV